MDEYLLTVVTKLKDNNYKDLTIVLGNESCDLDSAVSSLVYACFLNWQYNQIKCKVCTKENRPNTMKDDIFIPILNVNRTDYPLKTEVVYLFKKYGIFEKHLIFRDDHNLKNLMTQCKTKVVLVDHHTLANDDEYLTEAVNEIIDHRPLNKTQWSFKEDTRSTIEIVGSCTTLVAQRIKDLSSLITEEDVFFSSYPVCSSLLHATIILDTVNFCKEVNKGTPHDEEVMLFLENSMKLDDCENKRKCILNDLVTARCDVSTLTAAQLLKKDVKIVGSILVPSFPILVKDFLKKPEVEAAVTDAILRLGCSAALLLGMDLSQGLKRDAAVYSPSGSDIADSLGKHLENWSQPCLGLTTEQLPEVTAFKYYWQTNLGASRKQYIPAVNDFQKI